MHNLIAIVAVLLFACVPTIISAHDGEQVTSPPWLEATSFPSRIIVSPGADPQTSLTVTWRTDATVSSAIAEIVKASGDSRFDAQAKAVPAKFERVNLEETLHGHDLSGTPNHGLGIVHYHSVVFDDLEPDTLYAYRVRGARGAWSEWFQARTAPVTGPVRFLYYGDAQYGILSHASRIFRQGALTASHPDFVIHAGDLVNKGDRDLEWGRMVSSK